MRLSKQVPQNRISILTLDDDPIITSTIQAYFQRSGYRVDVENNPYTAIERVRTGSYDILLLDFLMSPICGDQVVEEIRKFNQDLFIILLTGHKSMAPPVKTIRQLDIQGYYEKNDRFDQLELLVESCVKSIRQMRTIREYKSNLEKAYVQTIEVLRHVVESRDKETKGHSERVATLAKELAEEMRTQFAALKAKQKAKEIFGDITDFENVEVVKMRRYRHELLLILRDEDVNCIESFVTLIKSLSFDVDIILRLIP